MQVSIEVAALIAALTSVTGLGFAFYQRAWVLRQGAGSDVMQKISGAIQRGAQAFLRREYRAVAVLVIIVTVLLLLLSAIPGTGISAWTGLAYVTGALASGIAGYMGMYIAVRANVRTTQAASEGLNRGLRVAFASGTVMGTVVVSLALLGISLLFILFTSQLPPVQAASALAGFGFGGTSIAIFARVGGGIYTKAADVGADLVGKTEANIPEDDPRNPATIADNVGDNVGDVAGMGSDLFESYASSIIAAISLAALGGGLAADLRIAGQVFPLLVAAAGLLIGMGSTFLVQTKEGAGQVELLGSLRRGVYSASGLVAVAIVLLTLLLDLPIEVAVATITGLLAGVLIGFFTEYFTSDTYRPTRNLAESAKGGTGIVIIRGLALGMFSTIAPVLIVVLATLLATAAAGLYGVAVAAVGMLSTLGITLATDAYGPVADNAGGIAEMAHLPAEVRDRTDALDRLGNTTAATGKGFAIGSAAMTALALNAAFIAAIQGAQAGQGLEISRFVVDVLDARFITGLFLGGVLPFIFSALTMLAVGQAAQSIVEEVRRQFREIKGIMDGSAEPDYERCVGISTDGAIRQMIVPGLLAVLVPVGIAFLALIGEGNVISSFVGRETLIGMLIGSLVTAFMLAVMMANSGGAWDNAKKYIEAGNHGGKGSDAHKAAVVGDTVGDPFKDTSGPSLNILIKLLAIVALVIAPVLAPVAQELGADGVSATPPVTENVAGSAVEAAGNGADAVDSAVESAEQTETATQDAGEATPEGEASGG